MNQRTILVTGGSRGIGRAIVERFAQNGDRVAFFFHSDSVAAKAVEDAVGAYAFQIDVSDPKAVACGVRQVRETLGEISVLVNNAGVASIGLVTELSDEEWNRIVGTNLSGAFYLSRAVLPEMIRNHRGSIVNIGSMWGKTGASCEVAYSATKAGLRGLTMALAKEVGPSGIRVNCVEPGLINTEMNRSLDSETVDALTEETPLCRMGSAREVADTVFYLSSEQASFITGQILGVDGGFAV